MADVLPSNTKRSALNRVRFAGKDFFTFVDELVVRIKDQFGDEFNDFVSSGTGQMLIDMVAWAADNLAFYIDRQATESYLSTARTRRAVNRIARQIGYKVRYAVPASADLSVRLGNTFSFDVTIPKGFRFVSDSGVIYESVEDVTFPAGEGPTSTPRTVSVREGETRSSVFVSDGTAHQAFRLNPGRGRWVAGGTVKVFVDGDEWTESEFITFDQTNQFEVDYAQNPAILRFGDGAAGNIPVSGAEIRVEFVSTLGAKGMVLSNSITAVDKPLNVSFQSIPLLIEQSNPASGGADPESIESVKSRAPGFFAARDVAVTKEDYVSLARAYSDPHAGSVAEAQAFVAHSAATDFTLIGLLNDIKNTVLGVESNILSQTSQASTNIDQVDSYNTQISSDSSSISSSAGNISSDPLDSASTGELPSARSQVINAITQLNNILGSSDVATMHSYASTAIGNLNTALSHLGNIDNEVDSISKKSSSITSNSSLISNELTEIRGNVSSIESEITSNFKDVVFADADLVYDHVDGFLSDSCKANLVQVPILTRDADGFLVAPPVQLIRSLQKYLDERKEVTQVVEVVSGEQYLVKADVSVRVSVREGYVVTQVLSDVRKRIENIIRDKKFGEDLVLSELYAGVSPDPGSGYGGIEGVQYVVIEITGPSTKIDSDGNLIVDEGEIVTRGTISVESV